MQFSANDTWRKDLPVGTALAEPDGDEKSVAPFGYNAEVRVHKLFGATDMTIVQVFAGLDYHEETIRVAILDAEGMESVNRNCPNDVQCVGELILDHGYPNGVAIEACSGAAKFAHELHRHYGWDVRLAHPGYVNRLKQSPEKSDHDDALLLADLLRVDYLPEVWLAPQETLQLRRLVRYRQALAADRKNVKLRIRALLREERTAKAAANPWTKAWLEWIRDEAPLGEHARWVMDRHLKQLESIQQQICEAEKRLEKATQNDAVTQALLQQKGMGLVTAATMRAEIGEFERFKSGKQLSRFCSVTPLNASTGKRQADAGLVRQGNPELRRMVIQAAHRLARYDEKWRDLKLRLIQRGKPPAVAVAAVANRWVRWLYHQMVPSVATAT